MSKCMRSTRYYKRDPKYNSLFTTKKASDSVGVSAGSPPAAMAMARSDRYSAPESETDDSVCNPVDTGSTAVVRHDWIKASDERFVALGVYVLRAVTHASTQMLTHMHTSLHPSRQPPPHSDTREARTHACTHIYADTRVW